MRSLPSDFIAAINADDAPVSMLVLKLASGDVKFSDGLYGEGLPYIENISEEQDGGSFENYLSRGNLETCKLSVTLIYSDLSRSTIHNVISELQSMSADNLRCRAELWKKFVDIDGNDTCFPLLWNVYAVQDNSESFACREDQMLMPLELITLPGSENQKLSITDDPEKSYDYVIGKAEGLSLQLMEEESSKWTELLGDAEGNAVNAEYTGLIRVKDATKLLAGIHLINGEKVSLLPASAGYMRLTARAQSGTEAQEHSSGSRIFPAGAVFKYAACLPVGTLEKLRTSNEIDIYDEDGDLNVTEYRDLYSGGNEVLWPGLNPAQIWFNDRMPFLWKDQENQIDDKVFYGKSYGFGGATMVASPSDINKLDGKAAIKINFREFSAISGTLYGYTEPKDVAVPSVSEANLISFSENLKNGKFSITQNSGDWQTGDAWMEFRVNGTADIGDAAWVTAPLPDPKDTTGEYYNYASTILGVALNSAYHSNMRVRFDFYLVSSGGGEYSLFTGLLPKEYGSSITTGYIYALEQLWQQQVSPLSEAFMLDARIKMKMTCVDKAGSASYAWLRTGMERTFAPFPSHVYYSVWSYKRFYKSEPSAYITSTFGKNLSSRGTFISAKAKIKGTLRNTAGKATGTLKVYENGAEVHSASVDDGSAVDQDISLAATSWTELDSTTLKVEVKLTSLTGEITEGSAGFDFDGGIQWLLTYKSTTLDGLQVNYADTLYVDAVSTRGPDWTPARAVQAIAADHTSWAGLIDADSFDDRHDEFAAAGHFLNGTISGSSGSQDAIRTVLREGMAGLNYPLGKITMYSYLTDLAATVPVKSLMSVVRPDRESFPNRGFMQSANEMRSNRMFFRWNKNLSTGKYDGNVIKSDGTVFLNDQVVTFELVKSDIIGNSVANFLWNLWKYGYIIQDCEYPAEALAIEKHDLIESFSMADNDATANFIVVSCSQTHESAKEKRGLSAKIVMIKR
jgi:hypothetical protein